MFYFEKLLITDGVTKQLRLLKKKTQEKNSSCLWFFVRYHFFFPFNVCSIQMFARLQILKLLVQEGLRWFLLGCKFENILLLGGGRFYPFNWNSYHCLLFYSDRKQWIKAVCFEYGALHIWAFTDVYFKASNSLVRWHIQAIKFVVAGCGQWQIVVDW